MIINPGVCFNSDRHIDHAGDGRKTGIIDQQKIFPSPVLVRIPLVTDTKIWCVISGVIPGIIEAEQYPSVNIPRIKSFQMPGHVWGIIRTALWGSNSIFAKLGITSFSINSYAKAIPGRRQINTWQRSALFDHIRNGIKLWIHVRPFISCFIIKGFRLKSNIKFSFMESNRLLRVDKIKSFFGSCGGALCGTAFPSTWSICWLTISMCCWEYDCGR